MLLLLALVLTLLSIALKIISSGVILARDLAIRKNNSKNNNLVKAVELGIGFTANSIKTLSFIISRVRDVIISLGTIVMLFEVAMLIIFLVSSSAFVSLFSSQNEEGKLVLSSLTSSGVVRTSTLNKQKDNSGVSKPEGLSSESWNASDDIGRKVAYQACKPLFELKGDNILRYGLGSTALHYTDCSAFVCQVLQEGFHKTFDNKDTEVGFDFANCLRNNTKHIFVTSAMLSYVTNFKREAYIGTVSPDNLSICQTGDILVNMNHTVIFLGKNERGVYVTCEASSSRVTCWDNINLDGNKTRTVGFKGIYSTYSVVRPSKLLS